MGFSFDDKLPPFLASVPKVAILGERVLATYDRSVIGVRVPSSLRGKEPVEEVDIMWGILGPSS
jgi:hypothetical protein